MSSVLDRFRGQTVMLLQGPAGPFFADVASDLEACEATVFKVNFHGGDRHFFPGPRAIDYRGTLADWPASFRQLVCERSVDAIMVFGDCRPYHRRAIEVARELGLGVFVFEEGYVRPDYFTFEEGGVNGHSQLPRDADFYRHYDGPEVSRPPPVGNTFWEAARRVIVYAVAYTLTRSQYPGYEHHRDIHALSQAPKWARNIYRRLRYQVRDQGVTERLAGELKGRFFLVPLQVHYDFQLLHSPYRDVIPFIEEVVASFARHAPPDVKLVVKHHPFDRPYRDYTRLLDELARRHALVGRIIYTDVVHLPTVLQAALGTVVINSTVGLSSIQYGTPTKALGTAVYNIRGLTHQGSLDAFWDDPGRIDPVLRDRFLCYLIHTTQIPGSVWTSQRDWARSASDPLANQESPDVA